MKNRINYWKKGHPRLLFDQKTVCNIRLQTAEDEWMKKAWSNVLQKAEEMLKEAPIPEEYADSEYSQHGKYGEPAIQARCMGITLGLAYQVTGDSIYAKKLKEILIYYSSYRKWTGSECLDRDPAWTSELNTTRFGFGFAVGLDCIYDFLTGEERKKIVDALKNLGVLPLLSDWILPEKRVHALDSMGHNWWGVCVAQAGFAALALLDEVPEAAEWVRMVCEALPFWYEYGGEVLNNKCPNFDKKGGNYEGIGYANYSISEILLFGLACKNVLNLDQALAIPLLNKVGDFFLHFCYPTSSKEKPYLLVNFGDCSISGRFSETARMLLACGFENPGIRWYLERQEPCPDIFDLLYRDRIRLGSNQRPDYLGTSELYPDIGWAVMRKSWEEDSTLLAVKSGFTWNHAHADAGSFVVFHKGKPLIVDSGPCFYGRKEYRNYYCQSRAHNVILFNGEGEPAEDINYGVKHPGKLYHLMETKWMKYVYADATGPMSRYFSRNFRHFLWIGDVLLIIDDVRAYDSGYFQQLLHVDGVVEVKDKSALITHDGAVVEISCIYPENAILNVECSMKEQNPEASIPCLVFSIEGKRMEAKFITSITFHDEKQIRIPEVIGIEGRDMIGVRICQNGSDTDVFLNLRADGRRMHLNSNNCLFGWETDSYMLVMKHLDKSPMVNAENIEECLMIYGSYLRKDGKVYYDSLSKVFTAFPIAERKQLNIVLQGQKGINAKVAVPIKPDAVFLNGSAIKYSYDMERKMIEIKLRE